MRAQYSALDTTMAKANALSKYVQQQFYTKSSTTTTRTDASPAGGRLPARPTALPRPRSYGPQDAHSKQLRIDFPRR
jgi:hypothetical protein